MANTIEISVFSIFFLWFLLFNGTAAAEGVITCQKRSCSPDSIPVSFPFRLSNQSSRCGYPGFRLSCDKQDRTTISFGVGHSVQHYLVQTIEYQAQTMWINDPDDCLPRRFLNHEFNITNSPFTAQGHTENFTFFNCSNREPLPYVYPTVSCLSDWNYTVYAIPTNYALPTNYAPEVPLASVPLPSPSPSPSSSGCSVITTASIPVGHGSRSFPLLLENDIQLTWNEPECSACASRGGDCGYRPNDMTVGCSVSSSNAGLSRGAKYGIVLGAAVPGVLCIMGLANFTYGKIRAYHQRRRQRTTPAWDLDGPEPVVVVMGLDGPTIESYPKTVLGESRRLPKPNDSTCPICLAEYQPKETLRTIPECNHYFHADCVDEWLRMNATCPLCRNSPEGSSRGTRNSSSSFSFGVASSSTSSSSSSVPP